MNTEEREALNAAVARLDGWTYTGSRWHKDGHPPLMFLESDYLGDPRLWAPLLERMIQQGWMWRFSGGSFVVADGTGAFFCGNTTAEAVCRLFVALEGKV